MEDDSAAQFDVRAYGAVGDGSTRDTDAIQAALDDCRDSGGTVLVPPGTYLTAPLVVGDDTTLHLQAGATLQFVGDFSAFPTVQSRWEGWDQYGFHPCLWIKDAANVAITGRGVIDGGGEYWWNFYEAPDEEIPDGLLDRLAEFHEQNDKSDDVSSFTLRPPLFQIYESSNVTVSGVTLQNSPFWNTHVVYSKDVTIHDARIQNPAEAPNGDGIDIDSSESIRLSDTYINAGDDAICLKSGKNEEGRARARPASQITVTNCTVEAGHGGIVIGSEMSGDVRDVTVSNCTFTNTDRGIRIKTQRGRGGVVEDLRFDTIVMRNVACPFVVNGYYFMDIDSDPEPVDATTPMIRRVHFSNITARNVESAGFLAGLPEQYFETITFSNVDIDATRSLSATDLSPAMAEEYDQQHGLFCKSVDDVRFDDVTIRTAASPAMQFEETGAIDIDGLHVEDAPSPVVSASDVERLRIRGCDAPDEGTFLRASGDPSASISLTGNYGDLTAATETDPDGPSIETR
ncbi:glycoside hydrolase family 28 protein [Haloarchaeobius sp. TZWSO28]|uniref:glycoside hydrolase family 28 protein n=1 Tax=Haloarchaeobius sp. TZWSO28 TaxID=3446119 RepID=UPI003EBC03F3